LLQYCARGDNERFGVIEFAIAAKVSQSFKGSAHWFEKILKTCLNKGVQFVLLADIAKYLQQDKSALPVCKVIQGEIDGRSGALALQRL
jgi:hypothetical protein